MQIRESSAGIVKKSLKGYSYFVPSKLPPQLDWSTNLVNTLSKADFTLGKLAREGVKLPNPHLLIRPVYCQRSCFYLVKLKVLKQH